MSPLPFMSHRMFVAAVSAEERSARKTSVPVRHPILVQVQPSDSSLEVFELTPVRAGGPEGVAEEATVPGI